MCCKQTTFKDSIAGCPDTVRVNAVLAPDASYVWEITGAQGARYYLPFVTTAQGVPAAIDMTALPEGFCNPYAGDFTVRVKKSIESCDYERMTLAVRYEEICVEIRQSTTDKDWLGCELIPEMLWPVPAPHFISLTGIVGEEAIDERLIGRTVTFLRVNGVYKDSGFTVSGDTLTFTDGSTLDADDVLKIFFA